MQDSQKMPLDLATISTAAKIAQKGIPVISSIFKWISLKSYPKAKKNSIGIAIAIDVESSVNKEQIKNDFINTIESQLITVRSTKPFSLVNFPQHQAEEINAKVKTREDGMNVLDKCRCQFLIFGTVRKRNLKNKGGSFYVLDLHHLILYERLVLQSYSDLVVEEMGELLPPRREISTDNDLYEFEANATGIGLATKYFVATAAYLSQNSDHSLELYGELLQQLQGMRNYQATPEIKQYIQLLKAKVINNIGEVQLNYAEQYQRRWRKTRDIKDLEVMMDHLRKSELYLPKTYGGTVLKALYYFVRDRNTKLARKEIAPWKKDIRINDATWAFDEAFLTAFDGKLKETYRFYKIAFRRETDSAVLLEVEEFLDWVLSEYPDKHQFYFCSGMINYLGKEDYKTAKEDFSKFISACKDGQFEEQKKQAEIYLNEINNK